MTKHLVNGRMTKDGHKSPQFCEVEVRLDDFEVRQDSAGPVAHLSVNRGRHVCTMLRILAPIWQPPAVYGDARRRRESSVAHAQSLAALQSCDVTQDCLGSFLIAAWERCRRVALRSSFHHVQS